MREIKEIFEENCTGVDSFQRVDRLHCLDLYLGYDVQFRHTLLLISNVYTNCMLSSSLIEVNIGKRNDGKYAIAFSLLENKYLDLFYTFCYDLIESSRGIRVVDKGSIFICDRYIKWQNMLKKRKHNLLTFSEIKGLIGELFFLKNTLFALCGQEKAVLSWIGPDKADQDFVTDKAWFEIKTTVTGSNSVNISSIEQLDTKNEGYLIVEYFDSTSREDENKITINELVKEICNTIEKESILMLFKDLLFKKGYIYHSEYDEYCFRYMKTNVYIVGENFPCIRMANIPLSVQRVKYELQLNALEEYKGEIEREC